jgi:choline monooxygenase
MDFEFSSAIANLLIGTFISNFLVCIKACKTENDVLDLQGKFMSANLNRWVSEDQMASIRAPIAQARTLPRKSFTDEGFFDLERERIFSQHWSAICYSEQLPERGCLLPLEFLGMPLLVVHSKDGELKVFHNVVPYDGCLAVIEPITVSEHIQTPYHGWCYDLNGKLLSIPFWNGLEKPDLSALNGRFGDLKEVKSRTELGVIFVDISGDAGDFDQQIYPLKHALSDYRINELNIGLAGDETLLVDEENLATNWKTHYENWAINVLHEGFTHEVYEESPQIPRVNAAGEKTYIEHIDGDFMALSYRESDFSETYELEDLPFNHLGIDPDKLPELAYIGSLFPNFHIAVFPYFIHTIISLPVSAGLTKTLRAQFYDESSARDPEFFVERKELQADFQGAGLEDGRITEAVQKARYSPAFEQQFYSPFWDQMHYTFSNRVLDALEHKRT